MRREKETAPALAAPGRLTGHFDRRLDSVEAAISLAVFEDFGFCNTFAALDATFGDVRTEFLDKVKPPFKMDVSLSLNLSSAFDCISHSRRSQGKLGNHEMEVKCWDLRVRGWRLAYLPSKSPTQWE